MGSLLFLQAHMLFSSFCSRIDAAVPGSHGHSVQLYCLTVNFYTRDPRDRLYAFTSVHQCFASIEPDYNISVEECFQGATYTILCDGRDWTCEFFIYPSASPFLPSWTMDFADLRPGSLVAGGAIFGFPFQFQNYQADSHATFRLQRLEQGALSTAGFVFDQVAVISRLTKLSRNGPLDFLTAAGSLIRERLHSLVRGESFWDEKKKEQLFRVVTAGKFPDETLRSMMTSDMKGIHDAVKDICEISSLFITEKGFIGLAPSNITIGDSIAIFATGKLPFVLRRVGTEQVQGDAYILLGGCFVDGTYRRQLHTGFVLIWTGIMHGQAVKQEARRVFARQSIGFLRGWRITGLDSEEKSMVSNP